MKAITILRQQAGWSKAELARRAGMHPTQVGLIESGRMIPYETQLQKLADALGFQDDLPIGLLAEEGRDE